jgi:nucleotide-binding universal stress UspA family protein
MQKMYRKILVPLDGSDLVEGTLNQVRALAKEASVEEVTLLNVVNVDTRYSELYGKNFSVSKLRESLCDSAREYLAEIGSRLNAEGIKVKTKALPSGSPARKITEYAGKNGMELIVMATHGYTGLRKLMAGRVASKVLNSSPVPVLLIRPESCAL